MIPSTLQTPTATKVRYPGLRPYEVHEHDIFFGREDEIGAMLEILQLTRFLTLLGPAGMGKTSLLQAGLIARLTLSGEEFSGKGGTDWRVVNFTPGSKDPVWSLSQALAAPGRLMPVENRDPHYLALIDRRLRKSHQGLLDVFDDSSLGNGNGNLLLVIDQLEDIFRGADKESQAEEAIHFVNLLLTASKARDRAIYIALALQSDFIGLITEFPGLSEAIMEGKYVVPSMNGKDLEEAIRGPLPRFASIDDGLVKQLIEVYEDQERRTYEKKAPLPVFQYTLMRTLEEPIRESGGDPVHLSTINFHIGRLSDDLDKIYQKGLESPEKRWICEKMFKALTEKKGEGLWTTRSETLDNIAQIAQVGSHEEVIGVIRRFQEKGRSFIQTSEAETGIHGSMNVKIAHEFLVAEWEQLKQWMDEEFEAKAIYRRLKDAATIYKDRGENKQDFLRDPQLTLAWDFFRHHKTALQPHPEKDWPGFNKRPNIFWAARYDERGDAVNFPYAYDFLEKSYTDHMAKLEAERKSTENRLRAARRRTIIFGILFLLSAIAGAVAMVAFSYAGTQTVFARRAAKRAQKAEIDAKKEQLNAVFARIEADSAKEEAEIALEKEERTTRKLEKTVVELNSTLAALEESQASLIIERDRSDSLALVAEEKRKEAERFFAKARCLGIKSRAQAVAAFSLSEDEDSRLKGCLAKEAYELNQGGDCAGSEVSFNAYDPNIYAALHASLKKLEGERYNHVLILSTRAQLREALGLPVGERNPHFGVVRGMVFRDKDPTVPRATYETLFTASGDGKVFAVRPDRLRYVHPDSLRYVLADTNYTDSMISPINQQQLLPPRLYKEMALSDNGKWIALGGDMGSLYLISTLNPSAPPVVLPAHRSQGINDITAFTRSTPSLKFSGFITAGADKRIQFHSLRGATEDFFLETGEEVTSLAVSPDGQILAGGTREGNILLWAFESEESLKPVLVKRLVQGSSDPVTCLAYASNKNLIASGHESGTLMMWKIDKAQIVSRKDHGAAITDLQFWTPPPGSAQPEVLATSSFDGSIRVYRMKLEKGKYAPEANTYQPLVLKEPENDESLWAASLTFDLEGRYLYAGYRNGLVKKWVLDPRELYNRVSRNTQVKKGLTDDERERYMGEDF